MIRLGIIGCGNMTGQHLNSFEVLKDKLEITVTCDLNRERAERAKEILSAKRFDADYQNILNDVDAVLIALDLDSDFFIDCHLNRLLRFLMYCMGAYTVFCVTLFRVFRAVGIKITEKLFVFRKAPTHTFYVFFCFKEPQKRSSLAREAKSTYCVVITAARFKIGHTP